MEGLLLRSSINAVIQRPQACFQQAKTRLSQISQPSYCSSISTRTISHSLKSGHNSSVRFSSTSKKRNMNKVGTAQAAVQTGDRISMADFDDIIIYNAEGGTVKFTELWDHKDEADIISGKHDRISRSRMIMEMNAGFTVQGKAVVAFLRHFGCPFCWEFASALRDAKPTFDAAGYKLITIGVGPSSKARVLAEKLPFPAECLYADPDRKAYDAMGLYHGIARTWLNPASLQIFGRIDKVVQAVKGWNLDVMPDNTSSTLQQGGVYVFEGSTVLYARKDESTGDHSKIDDILQSCCTPVMA